MGVYIKGMEMPTSCISCLLNFGEKRPEYGLTICCPYSDGVILWRDKAFDNVRLASCGIVPVQPHGRLIDADALADVFRGFIAMYDSCPFSQLSFTDKARRDELQSALAEVINAPTIIPAEEETE